MKANTSRALLILFIILFIAFLRVSLVDYANFAPIAAAGIFGIYFLRNKRFGIVYALIALFLSDVFLSAMNGTSLYAGRMVDYVALSIGLVFAYFLLKKKRNFTNSIFGAVGGSLLFFLISNFGVWAFSGMYPKNGLGLLTSYEMGIPFYWGTLVGDVLFTAVFILGFQALTVAVPQLQEKTIA